LISIELLPILSDKITILVVLQKKISNDDVALRVAIQAYSSGRVTWSPPALFCSSCGVKVAYFPLTRQNCTMVFKSYTCNSSEVDLQYAMDNQGNEIKEIQYDEGFSDEDMRRHTHTHPRQKGIEYGCADMAILVIVSVS
uniref:Neurotransmitter-gated ion-channel ligand-binding domain-containing protein n=1 Tax=Hucho hucho TaxID=62062 RepID=A0A4W5RFL1_9TELE